MNDCVIYLVLLCTSGVPVLKLISSCHYHIDGVSWFQGLFDTFVSLSGPKEMTYSQAIFHKWHSLVALTSTSGCGIVIFSRPGSGEILFISGRYLSILGSFFIVVVSWLMFWAQVLGLFFQCSQRPQGRRSSRCGQIELPPRV